MSGGSEINELEIEERISDLRDIGASNCELRLADFLDFHMIASEIYHSLCHDPSESALNKNKERFLILRELASEKMSFARSAEEKEALQAFLSYQQSDNLDAWVRLFSSEIRGFPSEYQMKFRKSVRALSCILVFAWRNAGHARFIERYIHHCAHRSIYFSRSECELEKSIAGLFQRASLLAEEPVIFWRLTGGQKIRASR